MPRLRDSLSRNARLHVDIACRIRGTVKQFSETPSIFER